jgi:LysR family transcriptional regulator, carnitine catabolism transcriptional activator
MNPAINLMHLKFFCDAVEYESIAEAAKMNFISASAVSQAISKLEIIFDAQLIFHNRQKLQATDEGEIVFKRASIIFRNVQDIFKEVNQARKEVTGNVKFVTIKSLGMSFIAPLYKQIKENIPQINFKFEMGGVNFIRTSLRREDAEFAIVVNSDDFENYDKRTLKKGVFHLYQAKGASPDLVNKGVLIDNLDGRYVKELITYLEECEHSNSILDTTAGWDLTAHFTHLNVGVGFFPEFLVSHNRYPNIKIHPLKTPKFPYEICAIFNKGVKLSRSAELFLEQLSEQ